MSHASAGSISQPTSLPVVPVNELLPWALFGGLLMLLAVALLVTILLRVRGHDVRWRRAAVVGGIGALLLLGNFGLLQQEWLKKTWPVALILIGGFILRDRLRGNS